MNGVLDAESMLCVAYDSNQRFLELLGILKHMQHIAVDELKLILLWFLYLTCKRKGVFRFNGKNTHFLTVPLFYAMFLHDRIHWSDSLNTKSSNTLCDKYYIVKTYFFLT